MGMTENPEPIDWDARLRAAVEKTLAEKARRRAERLEFQTRRNHGLVARHARKLARKKENEA
jgi:hypothetical protein